MAQALYLRQLKPRPVCDCLGLPMTFGPSYRIYGHAPTSFIRYCSFASYRCFCRDDRTSNWFLHNNRQLGSESFHEPSAPIANPLGCDLANQSTCVIVLYSHLRYRKGPKRTFDLFAGPLFPLPWAIESKHARLRASRFHVL